MSQKMLKTKPNPRHS